MSKEYRTQEQRKSICENVSNGNAMDAAIEAADGWFFAKEICDFLKKDIDEGLNIIERDDAVYLAERAEERRCR